MEPKNCTGSPTAEVVQQLSQRAADCRSCYEQLLKEDPNAKGRVVVSVRVTTSGNLEQAKVVEDSIGQYDFHRCILSRFQEPLSAAIEADCAEVNVPLRFEPKKPAPPSDSAQPPSPPSP